MKKCEINEINLIKQFIDNNQVVAIPTDTIYGIATNVTSYKKIIELKKRDKKPLAILCQSIEAMQNIISIPKLHLESLKYLTPGALTIVGKTIDEKYNINAGFDTTGVRIPAHPSLLKLLKVTGPLVVSSANVSGEGETYLVEEVENIFNDSIALYVNNDQELSKTASTVLNIDTLEVYRKGANCSEILDVLKSDLK